MIVWWGKCQASSVQTGDLVLMLGLLHAVSLSQQVLNAPGLELTYVHPHACVQICALRQCAEE